MIFVVPSLLLLPGDFRYSFMCVSVCSWKKAPVETLRKKNQCRVETHSLKVCVCVCVWCPRVGLRWCLVAYVPLHLYTLLHTQSHDALVQTACPEESETRRVWDQETRRAWDQETRNVRDQESQRPGMSETRRVRDQESQRQGELETRRVRDQES